MFKAGDRVVDAKHGLGPGVVRTEAEIKGLYRVRFDTYTGYADPDDCHLCFGQELRIAPTLHVFKAGGPIEVGDPVVLRSARDNAGKPESDYILTYPSGVDAVFSGAFPYYRTLDALHEWYVGEYPGTDRTVEWLRTDAGNAGHDLVAALAETNTRAEKSGKYKQGNYLLGSNWRQYCQSAVRHAQALQKGETYDAEGNNHLGAFVFNILALDMCVTQNLGVDDRIRPPST